MKLAVTLTVALSLWLPTTEALGITTFKGRDCKGGVLVDYKQSVSQRQCISTPRKPQSIQIYKNYVYADTLKFRTRNLENCDGEFAEYSFNNLAGYHCMNTKQDGIGSFSWFR